MYLLFDIGGTKMRVARSKDGKSFDRFSIVPTPLDFDAGIEAFKHAAEALLEGDTVKGIAGGIAGPLMPDRSGLADSRNLSGWSRKPLVKTLEELFRTPVMLENDTAVVGLGEARVGAGKGEDIVVYITVSTGVGGARIVHHRIDENARGFEPGHQIIDINAIGTFCTGCGETGHLEGYISGKAFERRYGKKPVEVMEKSAWEEAARYLGVGLANTLLHWSPDVVVLGGSMITGNPGIPLDRVEFYLKKYLTIFPELPKIKKATLGDLGGLHGALVLLSS